MTDALRAALHNDFPRFVAGIHAKYGLRPPSLIRRTQAAKTESLQDKPNLGSEPR